MRRQVAVGCLGIYGALNAMYGRYIEQEAVCGRGVAYQLNVSGFIIDNGEGVGNRR
jgi:hypothetical protein